MNHTPLGYEVNPGDRQPGATVPHLPAEFDDRAPGSAPGRDRTCDQVLRRHLLYPLSYGRSYAARVAADASCGGGYSALWYAGGKRFGP